VVLVGGGGIGYWWEKSKYTYVVSYKIAVFHI